MFVSREHTIVVFQLLAKIPCVSDVLTICVIVPIQDGSNSLSKLVGMASSSQDLLFIDMISFWTSSILRGINWFSCGMLLTWGLNTLALLSSSLIVCIFQMKKSAKSLAISPCDLLSVRGLICFLLVTTLTKENSCLESLPQSKIFFIIICCLWYTISQLYMFLSLVYAVHWWGCLYLLHALCLDLTVSCWPLAYFLTPWLSRLVWAVYCF